MSVPDDPEAILEDDETENGYPAGELLLDILTVLTLALVVVSDTEQVTINVVSQNKILVLYVGSIFALLSILAGYMRMVDVDSRPKQAIVALLVAQIVGVIVGVIGVYQLTLVYLAPLILPGTALSFVSILRNNVM